MAQLDALTGGAFTAPTSGERAARVRDWLETGPSVESMSDVFRELSHRDKGAAKPLKERLDELKRAKAQEAIAEEWAARAQALLSQQRLNLADAMAWQRDAAKAGAPLSREPLAGLKQLLADRMRAVEDLQHRIQVEREAAVLLAQRIEVLSTKSWKEAQAALELLRGDVGAWQQQADSLLGDPVWGSLDPKFGLQLDTSRQQLSLVWEAFDAALAQAVAAAADPQAPLPAVPVWADELRVQRGDVAAQPAPAGEPAEPAGRVSQALQVVKSALDALLRELAQGHGKALPKAVADLRSTLKAHGRHVDADLEAQVHAALVQAGELEGWQRWRADQLREELVAKAVALTQAPDGQRLGGRKMQESLRALREQWKTTDQGGVPNHALWKQFDEACNQAHKVVEEWLARIKEQNESNRAQRLALIEEVRSWTEAHADSDDWKAQIRDLHAFSERWRQSGHLSEKLFAEVQPLWKQAMHDAHVRLEAAQAESVSARQALIEEAQALGAAPVLRVDAVKALQQRWQQEAHRVPLERKHEQKLWEAFRKPIDEAFERKGAERGRSAAALSEHDRRVLDAAQALEAANASGDAQQIRSALDALQAAVRGQADPANAQPPAATAADEAGVASEDGAEPAAAPAQTPQKKLVAMRGDDRPGMAKAVPAAPTRFGGKGQDRRDGRGASQGPRDRDRFERPGAEPRGPRLGDVAFRRQREAVEHAEQALRKLAVQAHGEVLTQFLSAWERRDTAQVPAAQAIGGREAAGARAGWVQAIGSAPAHAPLGQAAATSLLRLEMAAELPTPAEHLEARRALQLQLLTRRHDPAPIQTWTQDVSTVLADAHDAASARRLQAVLKVLLRR
jgi:ATP-dependent RNA helicase SUPV3L1/SUV3